MVCSRLSVASWEYKVLGVVSAGAVFIKFLTHFPLRLMLSFLLALWHWFAVIRDPWSTLERL